MSRCSQRAPTNESPGTAMYHPKEYIRYEIVDFHGKALSKTVPARHRNSRVCLYAGALAMGANSEVQVAPSEVVSAGFPNGLLLPDWSTEQELPWASQPDKQVTVKRVYCEQSAVGSESEKSQAVPRTICRRLLHDLQTWNDQGLELMAGGELEFTLASETDGVWRPAFSGVDIFATLQNNKAMDFCYEVEQHMDLVGVDILTINAEYGPGQMEISFAPKLGIQALDMCATFRTGVKEMAVQRGLRATFMGKPFEKDGTGNGGHFNFSLWTGQVNMTRMESESPAGDAALEAGRGRLNALHCATDAQGLSHLARCFLAGVLLHAPAMEAICSPTPSCYLRRGRWAPAVANWGFDNRTCLMRVKANRLGRPADCYMELRAPSAAANPYLVAACLVAAGLDGLQRHLELPPPAQTQEQGAVPLPADLGSALECLEQDSWMVQKLGPVFVRWYTQVKRAELDGVTRRAFSTGDEEEAWRHFYMEFV